jgi:Zn-dependent protease
MGWYNLKQERIFMLSLEPAMIIARIFVLVIAFTVHEFAHAWSATYFGDETPRYNGRLTLNPLSHLDPIGSLLLLFVGFGWAKPVPVNPYALRRHSPAALMLVALAGPLSNLIMAVLAAIPFRLGLISTADIPLIPGQLLPSLPYIFWTFILINLVLMLFNLLPIAPLDGDKILDYFLPPQLSRSLDSIRPYGPMILMAVVFLGPMLGIPIIYYLVFGPTSFLASFLVG